MPAAESRPTIVSISGSPAATSEPNASSMMPSVTGQEMTSDLSIAERLAALKSDHIPAAPVRLTTTVLRREPVQGSLELVGRGDHFVGVLGGARPARSRCGRRGRSTARPPGATTVRTALFARSVCSTRAIADLNAGEPTVSVGRVDDGHQPVAAEAGEVPFDQLAGLHRLRAARFPARARESRLDFRREEPEHHRDHGPPDEDGAEMRRRVAPEAADRPDVRVGARPAPWRARRAQARWWCS